MDGENLGSAGIGAAIVAVIGGVTHATIRFLNAKQRHKRTHHHDTLRDYKDLLDRLEKDCEQFKNELKEIRTRLAEVEQQAANCERHRDAAHAHISYLEDLLDGAKIGHRKFDGIRE